MLEELLSVHSYFGLTEAAFFEQDLKDKYGDMEVREAIHAGILEHRRIPCGSGRTRCVCWLSTEGIKLARARAETGAILL